MKTLKQNRWAQLLTLLLCIAIPLTAYALNGPKSMDGQMRPSRYTIPQLSLADSTEVVIDEDGVIAAQLTASGSHTMATITSTFATIGTLPYPAKLNVALLDLGASSGTMTCTQIIIRGTDQFGRAQSETLPTISETITTVTADVWETVTYYQATGCASTSNGTATDALRISSSLYIGMPYKLRSACDIVSYCLVDVSDTPDHVDCYTGCGTKTGARVSLDEAAAVDLVHSAVNLIDSDLTESGFGGDVAADLDSATFIIRAVDPPNL